MFEFGDKWKNDIDIFLNNYNDDEIFIQYFYSKSLTMMYDTALKAIEENQDEDGNNKKQLDEIIKDHLELLPSKEFKVEDIDYYEFSNYLEMFRISLFQNLSYRRIN